MGGRGKWHAGGGNGVKRKGVWCLDERNVLRKRKENRWQRRRARVTKHKSGGRWTHAITDFGKV